MRPGDVDQARYDRSSRIGWLDIDAISSARVLVVGAGALGNEVVKDLVLSGFEHLTVVDMDHIVGSNLNRCVLFRDEDAEASSSKATVVADRAIRMVPGCHVEPIVSRVQDIGRDWSRYDVVMGCLDNVQARLHVNATAYASNVPLIDGGTDGMRGRVQVVTPPGPCLQCTMNRSHMRVMEHRYSCTGNDVVFFQPRMAAEITTTSAIAAIQSREALKLVCGRDDMVIRDVMFYDGDRCSMDVLECQVSPDCPNHATCSRPG